MRTEFKNVVSEGQFLIYPTPVIKEKKYLISLEEKFVDFFCYAIKQGFLKSPDYFPSWMVKNKIHTDGRTDIYEINYQKLEFQLLLYAEGDQEKAKTIEMLLTKKIIACLKSEEGATVDLIKSFEKQKKCSTCQKLGILEESLDKLINSLID